VELRVRDTGVGIPADELPHVFERFYRVPGAKARSHEGTGIGLALSQDLARLHGGTITAQSTPGEGTTFTVTLRTGSDHLPQEHVAAAPRPALPGTAGDAFLTEGLRCVPEAGATQDGSQDADPPAHDPAREIGGEDNA